MLYNRHEVTNQFESLLIEEAKLHFPKEQQLLIARNINQDTARKHENSPMDEDVYFL